MNEARSLGRDLPLSFSGRRMNDRADELARRLELPWPGCCTMASTPCAAN
jgi:hypothetical protein